MTRYGDDRNGIQARHLLHLFGQRTDDRSRVGHLAKLLSLQSETLHEIVVQVACHRVENLGSRCHGIFADSVAGEHIAQRIRDKENLVCILQSHVSRLSHGVYLEERVEVHELDSGLLVYLFLADFLVEVFLHHAEGMRVAVGERIAEDIPVFVHIYEVTSPGIDTDAFDMDAALRHEFQSGDNLIEEGEDVPIEVIAGLDESVVEAGEFFQFELALSQTSQDGSATGSTQVYGKEVFLLFHFYSVYFKLLLFVYGCKDRMKTQEGTIENDIRA